MIQHSPNEKPYKIKWLDAERELSIRGFPLKSTRPVTGPRAQISTFPVVSPSLLEKPRLPSKPS